MDIRLLELAGIDDNDTIALLEKMYQGRHNLNMDTEEMSIEEVQKRLEAAAYALGLVNKLRDPVYKKKHLSRVMSNMNTIRAAMNHMLKQID